MEIDAEGNEPLELTEAQIADETPEVPTLDEDAAPEEEEGGEVVISFGDDAEEGEDDAPLVKKLRAELRERDRKLAQLRRNPPASNDDDPEPVIPARPSIDAFDYDQDRFDAALEARDKAIQDHAEWKVRQGERERARQRAADDQAKQVEQQKRALGVGDYEERSSVVRDRLTDQQMAILINATDNPARLIYALGRSETRLAELAGIDNLARFAARIGQLERDVKVSKRKPPEPETRVRGATASLSYSGKELERLEKEAEKTGDRSKVIAYRRQMRQNAA